MLPEDYQDETRVQSELDEMPQKQTSNPKDIAGAKKPPLHLIPLNAKIAFAMAMKNGAERYGPFNWRDLDIQASAYIGAALRHIELWWDCGEEEAKDSGVHHLGHAMATLGILYDALVNEQLLDDRPTPSKASELMDSHTVDNRAEELSRYFPLTDEEALEDGVKQSESTRGKLEEWRNSPKIKSFVAPPEFYQTTGMGNPIIEEDDPRVLVVETPPFELDRDSLVEQSLKKWDDLDIEDESGWKRKLFRRSIIRKLDEILGVDLDFMASEDRRRRSPESVFMQAMDAGHSDQALRALLDELFGETTPYKGARSIVDDDPFYYLYHEPKSHGAPGEKTFISSTDATADKILKEILPPQVV